MTRRITLTMIAVVMISVLLAGLGTLLLARNEDQRTTRADLEATSNVMSFIFAELPLGTARDQASVRQRLTNVQDELRLADAELIILTDSQAIGNFPEGLDREALDFEALRRDGQISGTQGSIVYAAAFASRPAFDYVVILTDDTSKLTGPIFGWVVLSMVLALAAGSLLAWMLGRRLAAPVRAASSAAHQIAAGDLSVRLPVDEGRDDEITELAQTLNHMAGSLDRSKGLERQFLLSVSHDLRTPLTSIRGYAEAIGDGTTQDPSRAAEVIRSEAQRLERLVTDLLDLAKLDSRQFRMELRPTDLAEVIPDVCAGFEHEAGRHGVEVLVHGPDEPHVTYADPDRLAQVMANLLENALKYADQRVTVSYARSGPGLEVVVADDGPGIASEDLPHVFERLYVANQTPRRRETGSGLGLAIVRELVEAMGGQVTALQRPTGGTQFVVTLRPA